MKNEMEYDTIIAEFIKGAIGTIEKAGQFAIDELPGFIVEVLNWYFIYNLILFIIGIVIVIGVIFVDYTLYRISKKYGEENADPFALWFGWAFMGMFARAAIFVIIAQLFINLQWLKILIAPKLWLIEYAASLLK